MKPPSPRIFCTHNLYHREHIARADDPTAILEDPLFVTLENVGQPGMDARKGLLLRGDSPPKAKGLPLIDTMVNGLSASVS